MATKNLRIIIVILVIAVVVAVAIGLNVEKKKTKVVKKSQNSAVAVNPVVAEYKKQLATLEENAKKNPKDPKALRNYAVALYATGNLAAAKDEYLLELKINSKDPTLYNNLANVYRDSNQFEEAIVNYQKSIDLNQKMNPAYVNLAQMYFYTLAKKDLGLQTLSRAIELNPDWNAAKLVLAADDEENKQGDKAKELYRQVLMSDPSNATAKAGLAKVSGSAPTRTPASPTKVSSGSKTNL